MSNVVDRLAICAAFIKSIYYVLYIDIIYKIEKWLMENLNYHWLYNFWMTAREGSMTKAASRLGVTQPTVSSLVQDLERSLGQELFDRTHRTLRLSESGTVVFNYAEEIFSLGKEMQSVLMGHAPELRHPFRVGVAEVVLKILAQRLIDPVYTTEPAVSIECSSGSANSLLAKLATHEIDIVISDTPVPPTMNIRAFHHLLMDCNVVLVAQQALARSYRSKPVSALSTIPLLLPQRGSAFRQSIDFWLDEHSVSPLIRAEFDDTGIMKIAGAHGHGAFPVPEPIAREVCKDYNVEKVRTLTGLRYKLYLISLERKIKHPIVSLMIPARSASTKAKLLL